MIRLFGDSGIQIFPLNYSINRDLIKNSTSDYIIDLIAYQWTPIVFDASPRDYGRIYWKIESDKIIPILAIDTKVGEPKNGQLNQVDFGTKFSSNNANCFHPQLDHNYREYLDKLHNRKKDIDQVFYKKYSNNEMDPVREYLLYLDQLLININNDNIIKITDKRFSNGSIAGEFEFSKPQSEMDVNLYIDMGNSRTVGVFFEDNDRATTFNNAVFPLKLIDYFALLKSQSKGDYFNDDIFTSRLEFRDKIFPDYNPYSHTFSEISIVSLGSEATNLSSVYNENDTNTGLSGPKRYIWDSQKRNESWYISRGDYSDKIKGKILKYMNPKGNHQDCNIGIEAPQNPNYPRKSMTAFFLVEIINQAFIYINSPEHRESNSTLRKRVIKRLVLTYPTGWTKLMENQLLHEANLAVKIFCEYMNINKINVELGLDEATSSQLVFMHSQLEKYGQNIKSFGNGIFFNDDKENFRIASIDIGGGTTDVMVSEYNLQNYLDNNLLDGKIVFRDGSNIGADDLVKDLLENHIIMSLINSCEINPESRAYDILINQSGNIKTKQIRIQVMNNYYLPIVYFCLNRFENGLDPQVDGISSLYDLLRKISKEKIFKIEQTTLRQINKELNEELNWDITNEFSNNLILPTKLEFEKIIRNNKIFKILFDYCTTISKYKPSFVLLAGKITSLDFVADIIKKMMPSSPDRILQMNHFSPGSWYPFIKNYNIKDPKSTTIIGAAISDISINSTNFNGCNVTVKKSSENNARFINYTPINATNQGGKVLFEENTETDEIPITQDLILRYKNINSVNSNGNPFYKLCLKKGIRPYSNNIPKVKLKRDLDDPGKLTISENGFSGKIIINENVEDLSIEHISFHSQTLLNQVYYLDHGAFSV